MEIDQSADGTPVAGPSSVAATTAATTISPEAPSTPAPKQSSPTTKPPQIPEEYLRSIIMPLYMAQCSNKTFRHILAIIEHISVLPGARQIFLQQLTQSTTLIIPLCTADLDSLLALLNVTEEDIKIQQLTLESFTPSNSSQAKLLRILKTIDYIYTIKKTAVPASKSTHKNSLADSNDTVERMMNRLIGAGMLRGRQSSDSPTPSEASDSGDLIKRVGADTDALIAHFAQPSYNVLWERINDCLSKVQNNPKMLFVATVMLPLIECLMIVCKYMMAHNQRERERAGLPPVASSDQLTEDLFYAFTERHRKILNTLVRQNPKLLRGSFSLLVHNPKVLEFDNKRNYFNQQLHKKPPNQRSSTLNVSVRRNYIFQDSYYQLQNHPGNELKYGKLSVRFHGEEAADYGGVTREWFQELTKEMFNPNYALFTPSAEKTGVTYQPNPTSWVNPSHLLYFKFVGRVIGKAIYDQRLLDCYFTRSVYKRILGKPVDVNDMEAIDPEYYKSLVWILENDITDILDLTFSTEMDEFGQQKTIELKPDGQNIAVTEGNKHEYVKLMVENRLTTVIKDQLNAFLAGFHEIVPKDLVSIFSEKELELLISGVPDIDIDDWKNNTEYRGYTATSPQVQWFWRVVRSFDQEERAKLLQFATGTSKVPLEGFMNLQGIGGKQKFQIHKDFGKTNRLPTAHTCFNQIDLPVYDSYEQLRERLYTSITEGATGFGFE